MSNSVPGGFRTLDGMSRGVGLGLLDGTGARCYGQWRHSVRQTLKAHLADGVVGVDRASAACVGRLLYVLRETVIIDSNTNAKSRRWDFNGDRRGSVDKDHDGDVGRDLRAR